MIDIKKPPIIIAPNRSMEDIKALIGDKKIKDEYKSDIFNFLCVIKSKMPHFDTNVFLNNLDKLTIKKISIFDRYNRCGLYDIKTREVFMHPRHYKEAINHELFHSASSMPYNGLFYCGFSQSTKFNGVGGALTEGYTDVLAQRYFYYYSEITYHIEAFFAKFIEHIIGRMTMETLYSKMDLFGFVEELKRYNTEDEIFKFFRNIGKVNSSVLCYKNRRVVVECASFIATCYQNKQLLRLESGEITLEHYQSNIKHFLKSLYSNISFPDYKLFKNGENKEMMKLELKRVLN